MTTMLKRNNNNFHSLLLLFAVFAFPTTNAIPPQDIDTICKESQEIKVCEEFIKTDPELARATKHHLEHVLQVALSAVRKEAREVNFQNGRGEHFPNNQMAKLRKQLTDPVGKNRFEKCKSDYKKAYDEFHMAWRKGNVGGLPGVINPLVREGVNAVIGCDNRFKWKPVQKSPFTPYNERIMKLAKIIFYITRKLASPKV